MVDLPARVPPSEERTVPVDDFLVEVLGLVDDFRVPVLFLLPEEDFFFLVEDDFLLPVLGFLADLEGEAAGDVMPSLLFAFGRARFV